MKRILIVKCGTTNPVVLARSGDYDRWFTRSMGGDPGRFRIVEAERGEPVPDFDEFSGVILTGSPCSVTAPEPWMEGVMERLRASERAPVLGVCFGHQLMARAFGGRVEKNPAGEELGSARIELTEHPLFDGIPREATFASLHEDHVAELPPGARVLARNAHTPVQAFAIGERILAVQFHPEADAEILRGKIKYQVADLAERERRQNEVREAPDGPRVLANFERMCGP